MTEFESSGVLNLYGKVLRNADFQCFRKGEGDRGGTVDKKNFHSRGESVILRLCECNKLGVVYLCVINEDTARNCMEFKKKTGRKCEETDRDETI